MKYCPELRTPVRREGPGFLLSALLPALLLTSGAGPPTETQGGVAWLRERVMPHFEVCLVSILPQSGASSVPKGGII